MPNLDSENKDYFQKHCFMDSSTLNTQSEWQTLNFQATAEGVFYSTHLANQSKMVNILTNLYA
jgi:hypothetical protein